MMKLKVKALVPCGHLTVGHAKLRRHLEEVQKSDPNIFPEASWILQATEGIDLPVVESFDDQNNTSAIVAAEAGAATTFQALQRALNQAWSHALRQDTTPRQDT